SDLPGFPPPPALPELRYKLWTFRADYPTLSARCPAPNGIPGSFPLAPATGLGDAVSLSDTLRAGSGLYYLAQQSAGAAGFTLSAAALALRLGRLNWGAGAAALDYGAGSAADLLGVSSLVFRTGVIALGGSGKYFRQEVGGSSAHAWAGDAGVAIAVFDIMALGASVQNIGGRRSGAPPLPRRTRAGFTMNYVDPQGTFRLLTTVEGQWPEGH